MLFKRISFYLALLGILGVIFLVKQLRARPPAPPPLVEPARSPFTNSVAATGILMMSRVRTPIFTRNPYLFGDTTWGITYVTHGLAGVGLVGLVIAHVYFALRPEKLWLTKSMLLGWITRRQYLEHHDPERWVPR